MDAVGGGARLPLTRCVNAPADSPANIAHHRYPYQHNVSLPADDISMATIIKALYSPILHPIDASNFTDEDGEVHKLQGEPRFKEKLGKRVLILDIDSRPLTGDGQLMNEELKWKGMRPLSAGMLSHFMFGTRRTGDNYFDA
jgi:hypothetical protein